MAAAKKPAKGEKVIDRLDDRWDGVKIPMKDKNGKLINPGSAKKAPATGKK